MNKFALFFILLVIIAAGAGVWWFESNAQTSFEHVRVVDTGDSKTVRVYITDIPVEVSEVVIFASPIQRVIGSEVARQSVNGVTELVISVIPPLPRNRNYYTVIGLMPNGKSVTLGVAAGVATMQRSTVVVASHNEAQEAYATIVRAPSESAGPQDVSTIIPFKNSDLSSIGVQRVDLTGDGNEEQIIFTRDYGNSIRIYDAQGVLITEITPYDEEYQYGLSVKPLALYAHESFSRFFAVAPRWESAPGQGQQRPVKIYRYDPVASNQFVLHDEFIAFHNFEGGVSLAAGDVTGDGREELFTMPVGGRAEIRIHHFCDDLTTSCVQYYGPQKMTQPWSVYDRIFPYGKIALADLGVTVADINDDGIVDMLVYPTGGYKALMRVYQCDIQEEYRCFARQTHSAQLYHDSFEGGISVVVVHGNNPLVVVAPQADGGPHLKAFRITSSFELVYENFVYAPQFVGGVALAQGMTPEGIQYVATAPQTRGSPHIRFFNARTGVLMGERFIFDKWQRAPVTLE